MQLKSAIAAAIGVAALAIGGTAMAQTNIDTVAGDVFLNIVNTSNNTSFLYDTGVTQAQFGSGTGNYSIGLSGNSTYQQFVTAAGGSLTGSNIDYSVYSVTNNSSGPVILFTSNSPLAGSAANANTVAQATSALTTFLSGANGSAGNTATTPLAGSAILATANFFGQGNYEGVLGSNLLAAGGTDSAAVGTALDFYSTSAGSGRVATYNGVTTEPSTWNLSSAGLLTYGTVSAVPLPTPLLLLLSGLGFMGVVARRNKAA